MTVVPIKNGSQAIIKDLDDCYYYIHEYMGKDFLDELKTCVEPIDIQNDLDATKNELESYEVSLEDAQRALMDIKDIAERTIGLVRVKSQTAVDALREIIDIVDHEV